MFPPAIQSSCLLVSEPCPSCSVLDYFVLSPQPTTPHPLHPASLTNKQPYRGSDCPLGSLRSHSDPLALGESLCAPSRNCHYFNLPLFSTERKLLSISMCTTVLPTSSFLTYMWKVICRKKGSVIAKHGDTYVIPALWRQKQEDLQVQS